jgi:hypothetical protein
VLQLVSFLVDHRQSLEQRSTSRASTSAAATR